MINQRNSYAKIGAIVLVFVCLIIGDLQAQNNLKELWTKEFTYVRWQKVTNLGYYIIGSTKGITAVDPESGNVIWEKDIDISGPGHITEAPGSPFLTLKTSNSILLVDPNNGNVKFDSQKEGMSSIRDQVTLPQAGGVLLSGKGKGEKDALLIISMETGEVMAQINDKFGRLIVSEELSSSEVLIVTLFFNYRINVKSGETVWKNSTMGSREEKQLSKLGAFGAMMKEAAATQAQDMDFNVKFYRHPTKEIFYLGSERENESGSSSQMNQYSTSYTGFDMKTGDQIWSDPLEVRGPMGEMILYKDDLIVLPNDPTLTKINKYSSTDKSGKWGKKGRGIKVNGGVYKAMSSGSDLLFVTSKNSSSSLYYMNMEAGSFSFENPVKIYGDLLQAEKTAIGIICYTSSGINIFDTNTGTMKLENSIATDLSLTVQSNGKIYAYDNSKSALVILDKSTAEVTTLHEGIQFQGKEGPTNLELRDNGLLVSSSQNLYLVDFEGNKVYQKYLEAPKVKGLMKALQIANGIRAAYISASAAVVSESFSSASANSSDPGSGAVMQEMGNAYGQLSVEASDVARQSFARARKRFNLTKESNNTATILTVKDKVNYLVSVDKNTGEERGRLNIGKEKEPNYEVDPITAVIFYAPDYRSITAYQF